MRFTNEYYALVSQPASILHLATTYIRKKASYLSPQKIESNIFARKKRRIHTLAIRQLSCM